jgi:hypothetical protein
MGWTGHSSALAAGTRSRPVSSAHTREHRRRNERLLRWPVYMARRGVPALPVYTAMRSHGQHYTMASTARIQQWKLGQWSGLLEDFIVEWSDLESDQRSIDEARRRRAAALGRHGTPHPTRWLKVSSEHVAILVARGGDEWPAHRRQFGRCCHVGGAEEGNWGTRELTRGARPSATKARAQ